ncbi:sodium:solute symporter [Listeria booriae]|uniref:sodium:solute symporter family protein n=1 Tax=Listeria booriae TaxID=1552123 RepID=UPI001625D98A|nr:sodium:solute symporter [Listeria booriae]MBC2181366.1 sodium:solute symporter [Listeria booriae]
MIALIILTAFFLLTIAIGIRARQKQKMNLENWAVGGRSFNTVFVFLLTAGEVYTTFSFLGGSGWAYSKGISAVYVMVYIALSYVTSYFLLPLIWKYAHEHRLVSQSDFFARKYDSNLLGVVVALVGVIAIIPIVVIQLKGLGIIVSLTSYGAIPMKTAVVVGTVAIIIYSVISGIRGIAWIAVLKDFMILAVIVFMGIYIPIHYYGGIGPMFEQIEAVKPELLTFPHTTYTVTWFISTVLFYVLGFYMWPQVFASTFTAKNARTFRKNAIISPIYTLMLLFVIFIGLAAVLQIPGLEGDESDLALLQLAIQTFDPWFVGIIGAAGMLTALVPGSMLLMSASTLLTKNIIYSYKPNTPDAKIARLSKFLLPVLAIISCLFVFQGGNALAAILQVGYSLIVQLCPSLFASLMKRNPVTKQGALAGIIVGILITIFISNYSMTLATILPGVPTAISDINIGFLPLAANVIVTILVSLLTQKKPRTAL